MAPTRVDRNGPGRTGTGRLNPAKTDKAPRLYQGAALTASRCPICDVATEDPGPCATCLGADTLGTAVLKAVALVVALGCWGVAAALALS